MSSSIDDRQLSWPYPMTAAGEPLTLKTEIGELTISTATIPYEQYTTLLKREALLTALEFEGVEHWEGYARAKKRAEDNS
ncbi:host recBCD nuclease inhibitor protein [Rhizobium phage RHph_I46]|uniref:Host recBCD nuclease inhibitor protein n=1 Tax=Rhizobium phage RHph_I1_9 TaxID=2509729 RepID=A0A7S5R9K3_9CAUD|nr:host RecBCD nuclease inhibitor [Rhizobium phage RHph_I1_9]QIG69765.1 host recBCD nuclease inhibitor protein [Rhizobium phage RHph_I46]QIG71046.1 host recBCD nuclease inhibitor protein [Rhizobium phage RHph_I9]QIG73631.1 host recBCD nuclease inhibitor protein [Rhizobium phage RHph_I1_9]QIG76385.1 host recBCD nuclease inhibitor protein [Rhizobium phage RHph_I34]